MAVNSVPGRTQDQLHIHMDCLRASVRRAVHADLAGVGDRWVDLATPLVRGHRYRARWLPYDALSITDPILLLAADPAVSDRVEWALVMTEARRPSGAGGSHSATGPTSPTRICPPTRSSWTIDVRRCPPEQALAERLTTG